MSLKVLLTIMFLAFATAIAPAANLTWTNGDGGSSDITDADNWSPAQAVVNGDVLTFDNPGVGDPTWNADLDIDLTLSGGTWDFNITSRLYTKNFLDYSAAGLGVSQLSSGNSGSRVGTDGTSVWTIGTGNTLVVAAGRLELRQNLSIAGDGLLVLAAANASGNRGIAITAGTTLVNMGTATASNSDWSVSSGATLGGTGHVRSNRAGGISVSGIIAPGGNGTFGATIETLEVTLGSASRAMTMANGSEFAVDFGAADEADLLTINDGEFDLSAGDNTLAISGAVSPIAGTYLIYSGQNTGTFETVLYNGVDVTGSSDIEIAYNANDITVTVIPEPASMLLMGLGGVTMLLRGYRRV